MRFAVRADVGAVGAKLLYPDLSIQHAGVVIGIGGAAGHAHRSLPTGKPGYFRQPHVSQFVSAVTGACLVVEKRKFLAVDGLDEDELPVAFNDVDLCLKLQSAGWRNVYVPHAVLLHHESKTRESDISRKNIARFRREVSVLQDRWQTQTYQDPWHNPNLDRATENFIVRLLDEDGQSAA
jgi:GT2 family glycosyltransferase